MQKNKKILFLTPYPFDKAPSQRLKFEQYYAYLREHGYQVDTSSFMSYAFWGIVYKKGNTFKKILYTARGYGRRIIDLFRLRKYDVVYVHLWVTPLGPPLFEWLIRKVAKKLIYDIDDLIFISYEKGLLKLLKGKLKPIFLMRVSDHVITCTPFLDEFVQQYNSNTTDISSTINSETYTPVNPYSDKGMVTLGWSGSHSTSKFLYLLQDVLKEIYKEQPFRLLVMGDKDFSIEDLEVEALPWTAESEINILQRIDIGLYPLPLDDKWVMGKSGLKALQYMMLGIPTIATAIGANFRVIEDGVSGFLVKDGKEWKQRILELIKDHRLRERIGKAARERAENRFSIKGTAPVYLDVIKKVIEK